MKKPGMSTHSRESFDEAAEIRILTSVLESKHTIKTFFGSNDKTPNHDGFFELVSLDSAPKKQFIVQIKKIEDLKPNKRGPNKGKYVYKLKTNFLYYVKKKVTESPAIYFVVDIITKRIFWLYLSDKVLMDLNFEGHYSVSYAFSEEDVLTDIDSFTKTLNLIANERNRLFLNKTPTEIAEMQEAVDFVNSYLDHDFSVIKDTFFPGLWRFGIKLSNTSELTLKVNGAEFSPPVSSIIALYPQNKGVPDTGIREYVAEDSDLLGHICIGAEGKPIEYSRNTLHKIIKCFFEGRVPLKYMPDIALMELIGIFMDESNRLFESGSQDIEIKTEEAEKRFCYLANYLQHILTSDEATLHELQIRKIITANFSRTIRSGIRSSFRPAAFFFSNGSTEEFLKYCKDNPELPLVFNPKLFELMDNDYALFYCSIQEVNRRAIAKFLPVWDYSNNALRRLPAEEFDTKANSIIERWLGMLPDLYESTYRKLFTQERYRFKGKFLYKNKIDRLLFADYLSVFSIILYCSDTSFQIIRDDSIVGEFTEENKKLGVERIINGFMLDGFLTGKALFYNSISCLLYQGICRELKFKPEKLKILKSGSSTGLLLFE